MINRDDLKSAYVATTNKASALFTLGFAGIATDKKAQTAIAGGALVMCAVPAIIAVKPIVGAVAANVAFGAFLYGFVRGIKKTVAEMKQEDCDCPCSPDHPGCVVCRVA